MSTLVPSRWAGACVRACLLTWPRRVRERDGPALLDALEDELRGSAGAAGLRLLASECVSVAAAGLGMRRDAAVHNGRALTTGCAREAWQTARSAMRSPGFTAAVAVSIALGVGANAAVLGVAHRVLLTPPPYEQPDRLVYVWGTRGDSAERHRIAAPDVAALRERVEALAGIAFVGRMVDGALRTSEAGAALHVRQAPVSANLFEVLGVAPAIGRGFGGAAGADGAPTAARDPARGGDGPTGPAPSSVLISDGLWARAFGRDPTVVGRIAWLNGNLSGLYRAEDGPVVVAGVLPPDFRLVMPPSAGIATDVDVWVPVRTALAEMERSDGRRVDQDTDNTGAAIARLRPGVTLRQASAELARVAAELREEVPAYAVAGVGLEARSLQADATAEARPLLMALVAAAGIVLLVTCLNVSTLLLARDAGRRADLRVRVALGADRVRVLRHAVAEAMVPGALGTLLAAVAGVALHRLLLASLPAGIATAEAASPDLRLLALAATLATGTMLASAVVPALRAAGDAQRGRLASPATAERSARGGPREALVSVQVALSVVVLLGSGLLLRSVQELLAVRPGFVPEGAMTFNLAVRAPGRYQGPSERARLMKDIAGALSDLPGVRAVGLSGQLPLSGRRWTQPYGLPGQPVPEWARNRADFRTVSSGYFAAMGTRVLEGRVFTPREDLEEERRVVVVDEHLARRIAPEGSALGARIGLPLDGRPVEAEVVGVVEHVRHESLRADGREALYVPYRQEASRDVSFVVRSEGDPAALAPAIRRTLAALDEQLPVYGLRTLRDYVDAAVGPTRYGLGVLTGLAALALLCVGVGLYGVVALDTGRRTREVGVRLAVGARRRDVLASTMGRGLRLVLRGAASGAVLALAAARGLDRLVYGAGALDPAAWSWVLGAVLLVAVAACWGPAHRASRLDPTVALRHD